MTNSRRARRAHLLSEQLEDRLVPAIDLSVVEWRTIDGTSNNLAVLNQGAAETQQIRFGYGDDFPDDNGDQIVLAPNARTVSNAVLAQTGSIESNRLLTDWAFQWGQWVTHDMDLTRNGAAFDVLSDGTTGDFRIPVLDAGDPFGQGTLIPFHRSEYFAGTGVNGERREVVNSITSYIDASQVYGSDPVRAAALRTGVGGKLATSADGLLLPLWDPASGLPNADALGKGNQLFLAGDIRANEQLGLTAVHTLFVREHNRLADRIAQLDPTLTDEQIYQIARRLVGAEQQIITYREYLPAILGYDLAPKASDAEYDGVATDGDGIVDASVTNSFAHAAFRFGHSQINETTLLVNNLGQTVDDLSIRDAFFNPQFLKDDPGRLGQMLKGLASQVGQEVDLHLTDGIRNNLFGPPGAGGLDLGALDIQRGRDHGLPDFNNLFGAYRAGGLDANGAAVRLTSFAQLSGDPNVLDGAEATLQALYGSIDLLDPFVGMLAEDHLPGASVGRLLNAIIGNQFARSRDGDRFFYTLDPFLQDAAVKAILDIKDVTLANVIRWNTNVTGLQDNVFFDKSVLIFEAPAVGSNISVIAGAGLVSIVDTHTGQVHALRTLSSVKQVMLIGSDAAADVFNVFIASANGGIEYGVVAYGGGSTGDRLNVYGRPFLHDTFTVEDESFSTGTVDVQRRPPENALTQTVSRRKLSVNGNNIFASGFETTRLVTLGGHDTIVDPDMLALVFTVWNPWSNQ